MKFLLTGIALTAIIALTGCGSDGSSYTEAELQPSKTTTVYSGGGDVDINDVNVDEGGTYINNEDGTVTYSSGANAGGVGTGHTGTRPGAHSDAPDPSTFSANLSQKECNDLGFFFCTAEGKCKNTAATGGTCSARTNKSN